MSGNGEAPAPAPAAPRRIVLEFTDGPPPDVRIIPEGALATDFFLGAWYLDAVAHEVRANSVAAAPQIALARPGQLGHLAPGGLRRS